MVVVSALTEAAASDNVWKRRWRAAAWIYSLERNRVTVDALILQQGQVFMLKAPDCWREKAALFPSPGEISSWHPVVPMRRGRIRGKYTQESGMWSADGGRLQRGNKQGKQLPFVWSGLSVNQAAADIMWTDRAQITFDRGWEGAQEGRELKRWFYTGTLTGGWLRRVLWVVENTWKSCGKIVNFVCPQRCFQTPEFG